MDVLPQGRHFLQVVHHSFMFCGGRCAIIGGFKYDGLCAGVTLVARAVNHKFAITQNCTGRRGRRPLRSTRAFVITARGAGGEQCSPQCVKKRQFCHVENVGANSVRPPTWRSNAFFGKISHMANGHGRAMLAPTAHVWLYVGGGVAGSRSDQCPSGALNRTSGPALLDGGHRFGRQAPTPR